MINRKTIIILIAIMLSIYKVNAQKDTTNTEFYFNDSNVALARNNVKFNFLTPVSGDILVGYERALSDFISVEVRLGKLFGFGYPSALAFFDETTVLEDITGGFSFHAEAKLFYSFNAPEGFYYYAAYRRRNYTSSNENMLFNDFLGGYGYQAILGNRVLIGFNMGAGFRIESGIYYENKWNLPFDNFSVAFDIGLSIGYVF